MTYFQYCPDLTAEDRVPDGTKNYRKRAPIGQLESVWPYGRYEIIVR